MLTPLAKNSGGVVVWRSLISRCHGHRTNRRRRTQAPLLNCPTVKSHERDAGEIRVLKSKTSPVKTSKVKNIHNFCSFFSLYQSAEL
ncbi:MAG: hypothetical protein PUP93_20590 [Rhizonema sp. NSF051]|nr:hypothetical protein [Rhizonema sp. NSF051]